MFDRAPKCVNKVTSVSYVPTVTIITTIHTDKVVNTSAIYTRTKTNNTQNQNIGSTKVKGTIPEKRRQVTNENVKQKCVDKVHFFHKMTTG